MNHLIDISCLDNNEITKILEHANNFAHFDNDGNIISYKTKDNLKHKVIFNLFFEPSTRTRSSFELAAKNLSASVINLDVANSSVKKGESLKDTILTIAAMKADAIIVRHSEDHIAQFIAEVCGDKTIVINAGDGKNAHPTQALLDLYTIKQVKHHFEDLTIAIVGDILHSRVARSLLNGLQKMNCAKINIIAPAMLLPQKSNHWGNNVHIFHDLENGLKHADVIVCLRLQKERMQHTLILDEQSFFNEYGVTQKSLAYAKHNAIIMHPGPINRNVEISSDVADGKQSVILNQVTNGVAIRMAILDLYLNQ